MMGFRSRRNSAGTGSPLASLRRANSSADEITSLGRTVVCDDHGLYNGRSMNVAGALLEIQRCEALHGTAPPHKDRCFHMFCEARTCRSTRGMILRMADLER
jgi:hypothetical protein